MRPWESLRPRAGRGNAMLATTNSRISPRLISTRRVLGKPSAFARRNLHAVHLARLDLLFGRLAAGQNQGCRAGQQTRSHRELPTYAKTPTWVRREPSSCYNPCAARLSETAPVQATGGPRPRAAHPSADALPAAVRIATGGAVDLLVAAADGRRGPVFPAGAALRALIGIERHHLVVASVRVAPGDRVARRRLLQSVCDAGMIRLVHAAADGAADQDPDDGAADGHRGPGRAFTHLRTDHAAGDPAQDAADQLAIAAAELNPDVGEGRRILVMVLVIIVVTVVMMVLVVTLVPVLAPVAVRGRPGRRTAGKHDAPRTIHGRCAGDQPHLHLGLDRWPARKGGGARHAESGSDQESVKDVSAHRPPRSVSLSSRGTPSHAGP